MAETRITELTELTVIETGDLFPVVDINDLTQSSSGSTKKITIDSLETHLNATLTFLSSGDNVSALTNDAGYLTSETPQNLWETITSDSGSAVANTATDTLTIAGGTGISTAIVGDTLTITNDDPNATHTGDVTGSGALTLESVAITGQTTVTAVSGDFILISDTSDSGNLKKVDALDFLGGGAPPAGTGGIYGGDGNLPAGLTTATLTGSSVFRISTSANANTFRVASTFVELGTFTVVESDTGLRVQSPNGSYGSMDIKPYNPGDVGTEPFFRLKTSGGLVFGLHGGHVIAKLDNIGHNVRFGINTAAPTQALHVVGDCNVTGLYKANGVNGVASFTGAVTSITITNGIVTAIS